MGQHAVFLAVLPAKVLWIFGWILRLSIAETDIRAKNVCHSTGITEDWSDGCSPSNAGLSALDRRILRALQRNGRMSNAALAREVGLSPAACWTHTKDLFERGVIRGVRALLDPEAVGRGTLVLVGVVLDRSTPESFAAFEQAVRTLDQVLECVLVAGEVDYFLRIRVRDLAAFNRLHSERIIALPGVRQVRTFFVMNEIKTDGLLPV
jgi:Lrp/AsnC family leucine-responsive transcriptional regulator